eukprot:4281512-Prymnesium_polylepis.1
MRADQSAARAARIRVVTNGAGLGGTRTHDRGRGLQHTSMTHTHTHSPTGLSAKTSGGAASWFHLTHFRVSENGRRDCTPPLHHLALHSRLPGALAAL